MSGLKPKDLQVNETETEAEVIETFIARITELQLSGQLRGVILVLEAESEGMDVYSLGSCTASKIKEIVDTMVEAEEAERELADEPSKVIH